MELSLEVWGKHNKASRWWNACSLVSEEAEDQTIELVYTLLKEVGIVEFDEFHRSLEHPYYDGGGWKIGCIQKLHLDEDDCVVAVLVDGTETYLENFDCLTDSSIWNGITDSLGLNKD